MIEKYLDRYMAIDELGFFYMLMVRKCFDKENNTKLISVLQMPSTCIAKSNATCGLDCQFCQPDFRRSTVSFMCINSNESLKFYTKDEAYKEISRKYPNL